MTACRWNGRGLPRTITGRHDDDCPDNEVCRGCQPCTQPHCRVCGVAHSDGACPGCLDEARTNLDNITSRCAGLLTEATHRGVETEAMVLLGPATDPEAWGHREASALAGRIDATYLETARDEAHPLFVLATWGMVYRDAFEHDEPSTRVTVDDEAGYLARNLTYMAGFEWVPFEDFARDLRRCVAHLEAVLGDSSHGERTNIDCLECGGALERKLGKDGFDDFATCRDCRRRYTGPEYNFAVRADFIARAEWLTDQDMTERTGVAAATVRSWAREPKDGGEPLVRKGLQVARTVYAVVDVERVRDTKGLAPCA